MFLQNVFLYKKDILYVDEQSGFLFYLITAFRFIYVVANFLSVNSVLVCGIHHTPPSSTSVKE